MKIKIESFIYPNHITINQSAFVKINKQEHEVTVEAVYKVPENGSNMEIFVRDDISIVSSDIPVYLGSQEVNDRILKDAKLWTPVSINCHPTWPDAKIQLSVALGVKFSKVLLKWLGKKTMVEVVKRNSEEGYENCCASHDFCDANMAMDEAFNKVMGRGFEFNFDGDKEKEEGNSNDTELMNMAWSYAKSNNFFI